MLESYHLRRSGSALIVILPIIAILTLIILTVLSLALYDTNIAANNYEQTRVGSIAKYAIDDVSHKLYQIPLDRHWASGPGHIVYQANVNGNSWTYLELYSGTNGATAFANTDYLDGPTAVTAAKAVQLNVPLADGSYTIVSTNSEYANPPDMSVKWIYVLQNGSTVTNIASLPTTNVVGRYAYWTDIENGRVNINTAGFGMVNGPSGRMQFNVENWAGWSAPAGSDWRSYGDINTYSSVVVSANPWLSDHLNTNAATPVTFNNTMYASLDRGTAQTNSIQNLTAHPSSIDLSFLDFASTVTAAQRIQQSFDTFRYAGSYFLRVDALNSVTYFDATTPSNTNPPVVAPINPTPNPDTSVRFFNDPSDWQLIVSADTYRRNKGYLTVKGRSPEINPWGLPKIVLSLAAHDGLAINDLTEYYRRMNFVVGIPDTYGNRTASQDARQTQLPSIYPNYGTFNPNFSTPPLPLISNTRANFRDLSAANSGSTEIPYVAALVNDQKNIFITPFPGFANSLSTKYNSTSLGEPEQFSVELMSFVDNCLNNNPPNFAFDAMGLEYSGRAVPLAAQTASGNPLNDGETRRAGTSGPYLVNEVALQAGVVSYSSLGNLQALQVKPSPSTSAATSLTTPSAYFSNNNGAHVEVFLTRQPTENSPPDGGSPDFFVQVALRGETMIPPNYGLSQPLRGGYANYNPTWDNQGDITNCAVQYSTDGGTTWSGPILYDMDTTPGQSSSCYPHNNSWSKYLTVNTGVQEAVDITPQGILGGPSVSTTYSEMQRGMSSPCLYIGPFSPNQVVALKISPQLLFGNSGLWTIIPGIFPDVQQRAKTPVDLTLPSSIWSNFLEFDFIGTKTLKMINNYPDQIVSYEATDPRVTRHKGDWTVVAGAAGHTLNAVNNTITAMTAANRTLSMAKLVQPPNFLQVTRSILRWCAYTPPNTPPQKYTQVEGQTASRILGLPGVGYLSEVPRGLDGARQFWKTVNFHSNSENPPDWLLWNLFYVPFDRSIANQTDGKLNLNARLYPFKTSAGTPLLREKPLEALLGNRVATAATANTIATTIATGPPTVFGLYGGFPTDLYVYAGEICQVAGIADSSVGSTDYDQERITRDIADIVTTQSSDYRVFIIAQTLKQAPDGRLTPVTTQRIETTLSRDVDSGYDNYSFGNYENGSSPFYVYLRSAYRPTAGGATVPTAAKTNITSSAVWPAGYNPMGNDHTPNGPNNWIIPQKIQISSYKVIK